MTVHWMHVTASYALVLATFLALGLGAALRHRAARRRLALLDPRAQRDAVRSRAPNRPGTSP
ncbi:hypothetical protein [Siccirubricoccus sp. G192]|uniref:hypothetical protein n=1 Tax=Siccirubricoccus sp. G192 TaxID=2849651 RepID=UPI001C2BFC29|nr:hypothetical protein [Siccirubricoccus sp. G192]MBV1795842.1 hypothetical protein [Siccirubricoccus sp. G192]